GFERAHGQLFWIFSIGPHHPHRAGAQKDDTLVVRGHWHWRGSTCDHRFAIFGACLGRDGRGARHWGGSCAAGRRNKKQRRVKRRTSGTRSHFNNSPHRLTDDPPRIAALLELEIPRYVFAL